MQTEVRPIDEMEPYSYWVVRPEDEYFRPSRRVGDWKLDELYQVLNCDMIQIVTLAPVLPVSLEWGDGTRKNWDGFTQQYCMVVDEEFLLKPEPQPNFMASMLRNEVIQGIALLTPKASIK
jgi:hypothetical protein